MIILVSQEFNEFLQQFGLWFCLGIILVLALVIVLILLSARKKKSKKIKLSLEEGSNLLYDSLGGKDNITSYKLNGSRFSVEIKDSSKIIKERLDEIGIENSIIMSNKITLVLNEKGKKFIESFLNQSR